MRIALLGTGSAGRALATALARGGHDVVVGTRSPEATAARDDWQGVDLPLLPLSEVAAGADLVVNVTNGMASVEALGQLGSSLDGQVILDVANPLDFSQGFPPSLSVKDTDSLAEQIQRAFPAARVVKSLNTVNGAVMLDPIPGTTMFVAGDDAEARALVVALLREFGWDDVIEFDSLDAARGMEMWLPLWVRLVGVLGTPRFNLAIVRETPA
ncbi:MAG TPA: NAD(P)-binding domain-containing protein [Nocardioidaceae bacterium]|nr:NAD(P)-binding domain-containing protein [Nocardioidaceae bacterium]